MSGGLAFVLDEHGAFRGKVNAAMLDQLEELTDEDADEVARARRGAPAAHRLAGGPRACSTPGRSCCRAS